MLPNTWDLVLPLEDKTTKKRHYWFWTNEPDKGKTTFLETMETRYRTSWYNKSEVYQSVHTDSQFILIDEYTTADIKCTTINQMCDGNYQYPTKGGQSIKLNKPTLLICGNKHPMDLYPNAYKYIEARFIVINLDNEKYCEEWPPILRQPLKDTCDNI